MQPFAAAAVLTQFWSWLLVVALVLVILGLAIKEPLVVLARQRWVWRQPNPLTPAAARWLAAEVAGIAVCLALLVPRVPPIALAALSGAAVLLTLLAVWFTVKNKQRSVSLQLLSAAGLSSSALLVVLLSEKSLPGWAWLLWAVLTVHAGASIMVVHARLRLKAAGRNDVARGPRRTAFVAQAFQILVAGLFLIALSNPALSLPLLFSALWNTGELLRLPSPGVLQEPLKRVGYRALALSIAHTILVMVVFWGAASS